MLSTSQATSCGACPALRSICVSVKPIGAEGVFGFIFLIYSVAGFCLPRPEIRLLPFPIAFPAAATPMAGFTGPTSSTRLIGSLSYPLADCFTPSHNAAFASASPLSNEPKDLRNCTNCSGVICNKPPNSCAACPAHV